MWQIHGMVDLAIKAPEHKRGLLGVGRTPAY
jgi:hypothetical protein